MRVFILLEYLTAFIMWLQCALDAYVVCVGLLCMYASLSRIDVGVWGRGGVIVYGVCVCVCVFVCVFL